MERNSPAKRLVLLELNEISFDLVAKYLDNPRLTNWKRLMSGLVTQTRAEEEYELLEPWIQWASVHTGLPARSHGIFRLGDIVGTPHPQIFEEVEALGYRVGVISAMNAENRLRDPAYFIPDPWTNTASDATWWSRRLTAAVSQAVNDNAKSKLTPSSIMSLVLGLIRFARPENYALYLKLAATSRGAPWRRALLLDVLLNDLHLNWLAHKRPDFSTLFLNAGAHIQHHYMFSSRQGVDDSHQQIDNPGWYVARGVDPFADMLNVYDGILGSYLDRSDVALMIATGLSQEPYRKLEFYWRLQEHQAFLRHFGFENFQVHPRMTRDFLVIFETEDEAARAEARLRGFRVAGSEEPLFGEIDNRGRSVFVTLTFPSEVSEATRVTCEGRSELLRPWLAFVAIKNGMHQTRGYVYWSPDLTPLALPEDANVAGLHDAILRYFRGGAAP